MPLHSAFGRREVGGRNNWARRAETPLFPLFKRRTTFGWFVYVGHLNIREYPRLRIHSRDRWTLPRKVHGANFNRLLTKTLLLYYISMQS